MTHPRVRQGSVLTPIIIFGFCLFVVGVLVAPTLAFDFAMRSGGLKYAILGLPDQCPAYVKAIDRANKSEQPGLLGQVLGAAVQKQRDPYAHALNRLSVLAFSTQPSTPAAIHDCASELVSHFPNSSGVLLDFLENKYGTMTAARETHMTLYPAVVNACKRSPVCAKEIEVRYRNTKAPQTQEGLRLFLSDVGAAGAPALLTVVAETPHLGFGKSDSPEPLDKEISRLLEVAVKDESRRTAWLLFVQDKLQKPIVRWRVARIMRRARILTHDSWPIISDLLETPSLPLTERWDFYAEEAQAWTVTPQLLSHIGAEIDTDVATPWSVTPERREKWNRVLAVLEALKLAPPAELSEAMTKAKQDFSGSIDRWVLKTATTLGPTDPLVDQLLAAFDNQTLFALPLPSFYVLLSNPLSAELGLRLLLIENSPSPETHAAFKKFAGNSRNKVAEATLLRVAATNESAGLRLLTLTNSLDDPRRAHLLKKIQLAQVGAIARLEREVASGKLPLIDQVQKLSILINLKAQPQYARKLDKLISDHFTCDPTWTKPIGEVINSGPSHPLFLTALFKGASCPEEFLDLKAFAPVVNTLEARKKIQPHLNAKSKLTAVQLKRLGEVYGMANRIPGSAMPPKIKQPNGQ